MQPRSPEIKEPPLANVRHDHGISLDFPQAQQHRPPNVTHLSSPTYESPLRHHRRQPSTPRTVKETLHARSEYTNSEDDGAAIHRINQYVIKQEIGRGSFGAVHLAVDQHGAEYAVKEFSKSRLRKRAQSNILRRPHRAGQSPSHLGAGMNLPLHRRSASDIHENEEGGNSLYLIREEIAIMKKLNHPNLVSLLEVLDDPTEDSLYMVLEMCKKGVIMRVGINDAADPYCPEDCRCWFRDLILGIEYLHAQGIIHRDIKPDNLLLTEDDVLKIVDFGVSEIFEKHSDMTTTKSVGSPAFLPPELCVSRHGAISGKAADIWSMGVTLYCLYFGRVPFEKTGVLELYESIKADDLDLGTNCDEDFADLMRKLLDKNSKQRIKMPELRAHPWVTKNGADPLLSEEENTSNLVEPPTEEEMNRAITGNLSNLIVVMKAVRRFKGLLMKRRPALMDSILGQSRLVQPPLSIDRPSPIKLHEKAHSEETHDRKPVEQILAREGVHRKINPEIINLQSTERDDGIVIVDSPTATDFKPRHTLPHSKSAKPQREPPRAQTTPRSWDEPGHKGQAHDPTEEFLFLDVGPVGGDEPPDPPAVSESPPASDINIYETAYHEEVERIRRKSTNSNPTLYLTRRVDKTMEYANDDTMVGISQTAAHTGFMRALEHAKEKSADVKEKGTDAKDVAQHTKAKARIGKEHLASFLSHPKSTDE